MSTRAKYMTAYALTLAVALGSLWAFSINLAGAQAIDLAGAQALGMGVHVLSRVALMILTVVWAVDRGTNRILAVVLGVLAGQLLVASLILFVFSARTLRDRAAEARDTSSAADVSEIEASCRRWA